MATFNFIKKHQWISTVLFFGLGFIIYFFYFFKKGIPFVSGQEFIYITTATSTIFLLIPVIILLIVIIFYYLYITEKKEGIFKEGWLFYKSIFVDSLSFVLMIITVLVFRDTISEFIVGSNLEIGLSEVFELLGVMIIVSLLFTLLFSLSIRNKIMLFLCTIILPTIFLFIVSIKIGNLNSFFASFLIFFGAVLFYIFLLDKGENTSFYISFLIVIFIMILFGGTMNFIYNIYKKLNFGNINYSCLTFNKEAKEHIPSHLICEEILDENSSLNNLACLQDGIKVISFINDNLTFQYKDKNITYKNFPLRYLEFIDENNQIINIKDKKVKLEDKILTYEDNTHKQNVVAKVMANKYITYAKESNSTIKLYNIKALSTLREFWHLETTYGDKFEISKEFIKAKLKNEN